MCTACACAQAACAKDARAKGACVTAAHANAACACAGVHLKNGKTVEADLVVDATGKDSNVSKWLEKLGQAVPDTISVASGLRYTYRMYEMTDDPDRDWSVGVCMDHPEYNRTAVVIPVETNKWIVSHLQCTGSVIAIH